MAGQTSRGCAEFLPGPPRSLRRIGVRRRRRPGKGGTAARDKSRRSRVASLKLWPASARSPVSLRNGPTVAAAARNRQREPGLNLTRQRYRRGSTAVQSLLFFAFFSSLSSLSLSLAFL